MSSLSIRLSILLSNHQQQCKADCDTCKRGYYRYLSQQSSIHLCEKYIDDCMEYEGSDSNCTNYKDGYRLFGSVCEKIPNTKHILIVGEVVLFVIVIWIIVYWSCGKDMIKLSIDCRNDTSYNIDHHQGIQIEIAEE